MKLSDIKEKIHEKLFSVLEKEISELRPCQEKAIDAGLLEGKNLLVCTPTASGKTLIAEIAALETIIKKKRIAVYVAPLKALANEKYKEFSRKYSHICKTALSIGDLDKADPYLARYDLIIMTSEKFDSLIRHSCTWLNDVKLIIADEIHLLNDPGRGPTLEILITMLRKLIKDLQIIGLSATIGNPEELAEWLDAELVVDSWRPVELKKGVMVNNEIEFV
jgi:helicase